MTTKIYKINLKQNDLAIIMKKDRIKDIKLYITPIFLTKKIVVVKSLRLFSIIRTTTNVNVVVAFVVVIVAFAQESFEAQLLLFR